MSSVETFSIVGSIVNGLTNKSCYIDWRIDSMETWPGRPWMDSTVASTDTADGIHHWATGTKEVFTPDSRSCWHERYVSRCHAWLALYMLMTHQTSACSRHNQFYTANTCVWKWRWIGCYRVQRFICKRGPDAVVYVGSRKWEARGSSLVTH